LTLKWIYPGHLCARLFIRSSKILQTHKLVLKLQAFVYVAVTKEFTTIFYNEFAFLLEYSNPPWKNSTLTDAKIHGKHNKQIINFDESCTFAFKSCDG